MRVSRRPFKIRTPRDPNRSEGLHLSTVLRAMALDRHVLDSKYEEQGDLDGNIVLNIGLAWEDFLAKHQHPEIMYHPGELVLDGIAMSPDGISYADDPELAAQINVEPESWVLHEFKVTQKSSRGFLEKLESKDKKCLLWLWQIMAYRYALNRIAEDDMECYSACLHVLFLNGNYSRDFNDPENGPNYNIYNLQFEPEELETNWMVIRSYAESMTEQ